MKPYLRGEPYITARTQINSKFTPRIPHRRMGKRHPHRRRGKRHHHCGDVVSCVGGRRYFTYNSHRRNPTGREIFVPARTQIAVKLLTSRLSQSLRPPRLVSRLLSPSQMSCSSVWNPTYVVNPTYAAQYTAKFKIYSKKKSQSNAKYYQYSHQQLLALEVSHS